MSDVFIFLSYATQDGSIAMRVYNDLLRAKLIASDPQDGRLAAWRYEKDGALSADFEIEFAAKIRSAQFFCLLDSSRARRSEYVRRECTIARDGYATAGHPQMVVCTVQPRDQAEGEWWSTELFERQNFLRCIDLTDYDRGIRRLCEHLGAVYVPGFEIPRDKDFEREIFTAQLNPSDVEALLDMYANFRTHCSPPYTIAQAQLLVLIARCQALHADGVVSPRIALGVIQAETDRHPDALNTFQELTQTHPGDPRGWAGLGGAQFYLADYRSALDSYRRCEEAMRNQPCEERSDHATDVAHNLARVFLALGQADAAWSELAAVPAQEDGKPYIQALRGKILLTQGFANRALSHLQNAFAAYRDSPSLRAELVCDLAECYRNLGRRKDELETVATGISRLPEDPGIWWRAAGFFLQRCDFGGALTSLDWAISLAPNSLVYRAERASILRRAGDRERSYQEARHCLTIEAKTARDHYYRGLAFFLIEKRELAEHEFEQSRDDAVIRSWPAYAELFVS
jgi:tetratricopeptide (TPR) repeat protein